MATDALRMWLGRAVLSCRTKQDIDPEDRILWQATTQAALAKQTRSGASRCQQTLSHLRLPSVPERNPKFQAKDRYVVTLPGYLPSAGSETPSGLVTNGRHILLVQRVGILGAASYAGQTMR